MIARWITALALAASVTLAHAGRSCEPKPPEARNVARAMVLAEHTARMLDASGAQVVVLARAGQDLSAYGLRYSHLGLAYRDGGRWREGGKGPAAWRVVHKLNQCGSSTAAIYRQGLGEFFLDDLHEYQAGVVLLRADVQAALWPTLQDNQRLAQLHTPRYNMVAYPWAQSYQQSNQWAIETLAMAVDANATTRSRAQAWLQLQGYQPSTLRLSAFKRLGARMTAANVAFDDHPNDKRFSDRIETVTVDSVFAWLNRSGLGGPVQVVR
ncbi:MAG: DUF2145 domain-containing protein [Rhizobacter sp.]